MSKLYELSQELALLHDQVAEGGGELTVELEAALDQVTLALEKKSVSIGQWVLNLKADEAGVQQEIDRLQTRLRSRRNLQERLKTYVKQCMEHAGVTKIEHPTCPIRIQKNGQAALIIAEGKDITTFPAAFQDVIPEHTELSQERLKKALASGELVDGAELQRGTHLRVG